MHSRLTTAVLAMLVVGGAAIPAVRHVPRTYGMQISGEVPAPGMRAYVDPVTGELLPEPPPGVQPALAPQLIPDDSKLEFIEQPDGTKAVLFHGQREATIVATLAEDGSVKTQCHESTAALPTGSQPAKQDEHHE